MKAKTWESRRNFRTADKYKTYCNLFSHISWVKFLPTWFLSLSSKITFKIMWNLFFSLIGSHTIVSSLCLPFSWWFYCLFSFMKAMAEPILSILPSLLPLSHFYFWQFFFALSIMLHCKSVSWTWSHVP